MVENGHTREESEEDAQIRQTQTQSQATNWSNGQCVLAVQSCSMLKPKFDLSVCRTKLENAGFQIPVGDLEAPLRTALDTASVRRFMVFNSALFQFILAPVLYVVIWCSVFSTLHLYITGYWALSLSVTLLSIFPTTAIIFILQHSNKELNVNLDVRLVQVNERMVKHKLLVAVADWMQNCTGNMKLYFVYWDMSHCLRTLTETLEEHSTVVNIQDKLKKKMSHLILVAEDTAAEDEGGASDVEQGSDEQRPLLMNEAASCSTSARPKEGAKATANYSLLPDSSLPAQAKAHQLLMTYSALYVKLLVSEKLNRRPPCPRGGTHCGTAPFCLCQFIKKKIIESETC
ncbi:transmembrane protein 268 [Brachionichthys hirsutus]|uniref:transmembrane protein 268 n=1 Tax=Brachionichthys hirsutus TaxID=412623 RepID=UPI0036046578